MVYRGTAQRLGDVALAINMRRGVVSLCMLMEALKDGDGMFDKRGRLDMETKARGDR